MPELKEKPQMQKPKAKDSAILAPKQAAHMLAQKYRKQFDQRVSGEENETEYATNQTEQAATHTLDKISNGVQRLQIPQRKYRIKERTQAQQAPEPGQTDTVTPLQQLTAKKQYERLTAPKERQAAADQRIIPKERAITELKQRAYFKARSASIKPPLERLPEGRVTPRPTAGELRAMQTQSMINHRRRSVISTKQSQQAMVIKDTAQSMSQVQHSMLPSERPKTFRIGAIKEQKRASASTIKSRVNAIAKTKNHTKAVAAKIRPHTMQTTVKQMARKTRQQGQNQLTQHMVSQARKTAKAMFSIAKRAATAMTKAAAAFMLSLASMLGGGLLLVALVVVVVIAAVANSPFGIFFAAERNAPNTVSVAEAVATVNIAYNAKLEELQVGDYNSIEIHGQAADWTDVIAVFAVKLAGADVDGMDVATLDADRVNKLTDVFWDMTIITTEVEEIYHPGDPGWTERILHIYITPKTADDMRVEYHFTKYQNTALDELLADRAALASLTGSLTITNPDVSGVWDDLPKDITAERREAVRIALTLVGKVNYFWGGKSRAIGWDSRWGSLQKVWAAGNSTSGTYRPFGLDCSGYVDWIFNNSMRYIIGHGGGVRMQHRYCTNIPQSSAQPGDLAFYPDDSHIGIVVGRRADGKLMVAHCSSGQNNVVVTEFRASGFTVVGRPDVFD